MRYFNSLADLHRKTGNLRAKRKRFVYRILEKRSRSDTAGRINLKNLPDNIVHLSYVRAVGVGLQVAQKSVMLGLSKPMIFEEKLALLEGDLQVVGDLFPYTIKEVPSARRPDGFRFSKHIVVLQAKSRGIFSQGSGESSTTSSLAFEKAKSEVLERLCLEIVCSKTGTSQTSSGWAAHTSFSFARDSAALELLERDSVLIQWFRSRSLIEIEPRSLPFAIKWWRLTELSRSEFPNLSIMITTEGKYPAVLAVLHNGSGNGIVGTASSRSLGNAVDGALVEACRSAHHFVRGTFQEEVTSIMRGEKAAVRPGSHSVLYSQVNPLPDWFLKPTERIEWNEAQQLMNESILQKVIGETAIQFSHLAEGDRYVVKASSPHLQSVFWGNLSESQLNLERINLDLKSINQLPHIVG